MFKQTPMIRSREAEKLEMIQLIKNCEKITGTKLSIQFTNKLSTA